MRRWILWSEQLRYSDKESGLPIPKDIICSFQPMTYLRDQTKTHKELFSHPPSFPLKCSVICCLLELLQPFQITIWSWAQPSVFFMQLKAIYLCCSCELSHPTQQQQIWLDHSLDQALDIFRGFYHCLAPRALFFSPSSSTVPTLTHLLRSHTLQAINLTMQAFIPDGLLGWALEPLLPLTQPLPSNSSNHDS